jgi:RNA polymerase sigma-70 factor (ECF subfamily)
MTSLTLLSDRELLDEVDRNPDAFAVFYRRHLSAVLGFALARANDRELAADLTAEVFAAALESRAAFDSTRGEARPWLCGIAAHKLYDSWRRGVVEATARDRLAMNSIPLDESDLERVDEIATAEAQLGQLAELLDQLSPDVRAAVQARVLDEDEYRDIALRLRCSEQVVRKRVSRGLQSLRTRLRVDDA